MKYLSNRQGYWWVRIAPKKALLPYLPIKTKEFLQSLGAITESQAQRKAIPLINDWLKLIEKAEKQLLLTYGQTGKDANYQHIVQELMFSNANYTDLVADRVNDWLSETGLVEDYQQRSNTVAQVGEGVLSDFYINQYEQAITGENLKPKTVQQRINRIKTQFIPLFPYLDSNTLSTIKLQNWIDAYASKPEPPARQTVKDYLASARLYVEWLVRKGYINMGDTFSFVKLPSNKVLGATKKLPYTDHQLNRIIDAVKDADLKDYIFIALYTGMRIDEIAKLTVNDIEENDGRVLIFIREAKTKAGIRSVPVHKKIESIISTRISVTSDYLFQSASENKSGIRSDKHSKAFGRVKSKLGFNEQYDFHSLRRTFITKLDRAGVSERISADIVGHDLKTMTYGLYSGGSSTDDKFKAIDQVKYDMLD